MTFAENRKARHDYETLETYEGGLALTGQEVKSIREGGAKLHGAHLAISRGELWLLGTQIRPYSRSARNASYELDRTRKVLVTRRELESLAGKTEQKGLTLVPFSFYSRGRRIKLSFGLCRGRKAHDKRERIKARDLDRTVHRALRGEDVE